MRLLAPYTEAMYTQMMGNLPKDDDLERVNCPYAGQLGHRHCGVCPDCTRPRFSCGCDTHGYYQLPIIIED